MLDLQGKLLAAVSADGQTAAALAEKVAADPADCWPILQHLAANRADVHVVRGHEPAEATFLRR